MNTLAKWPLLFVVVIFATIVLQAANSAQTGTVVSENSVNCGSKGGKKRVDLLCQDYIVRTDSIEYHIRQSKPSDQALVPVNTKVQFTIEKDKVKFKIDGKSYQYVVVSEAAIGATQH